MLRTLERPRWEDYSYEPLEKTIRNRFFWLGNGATVSDMDPVGHKAFYLDNIDVPPGERTLHSKAQLLTTCESARVDRLGLS